MPMMNPARPGYSLEYLEVYNWGTFDKQIWKINLNCQTALLTGDNGSGKSTLVDAFLTLLVPNRKRTYNQASGDRRKERDEKTYVRGAYSRLREAGTRDGQIQYLRGGNGHYTVLLAVFHSTQAKSPYVTLAQVFWFTDTGLNKFHVVAQRPLSIAQHFSEFKSVSQLKKSLRQVGEVYDQFNDYSAAFRKLLRLRSDKALEIFSQTVSIKEIGSLNHFIREHMLEKTDADRQIQRLRDNFQNLTTAHEALVKAERQQALLTPITQEGDKYDQLTQQIDEARAAEAAIPHYFTYRRGELLVAALNDTQRELAEYETKLGQAQERFDGLDRERIQLQVEIKSDETGQILARLNEEITRLQRELYERQNRAGQYDKQAAALDLRPYGEVADFHANRQQIGEELSALEQGLVELRKQRDLLLVRIDRLRPQAKELEDEIQSLQQRRSQIPRQSLDIRADITQALKIDEGELPFAGELLRVRDEAQNWEGAVERVLHNFALNMLVPEQHYRRLSQYVNKKHLGGRLVYRRIDPNEALPKSRAIENTLYYKVEVKNDTPYTDWLRAEISRSFDYVCVENLEEFHHQRRALTLAGQIKHDTNRYEKDDRHDIHDRSRYVLGWDNRAKLKTLQEQHAKLVEEARRLNTKKTQIETELQQRAQRQDALKDFGRFDDFNALDWRTTQAAIDEKVASQRQLEASSNRLRQLQTQLGAIEQQHQQASKSRDQYTYLCQQRREAITRYEHEVAEAQSYLEANPLEQWEAQGQIVHREVERLAQPLTLDTFFKIRDQMRDTFSRRANSYMGQRGQIAQSLERQITGFRMEYRVETENIGSGLEALPELRILLERIVHEDLPRHRARFKEMLDKKVIDNIAAFKSELERQTEVYREVIDQLNTSLKDIPYEESAYIQLQAEPTNDIEISEFRHELHACLDDTLSGAPDANERAFERVRVLIQRFEKEERWTQKVSDVRNWLNFAAIELWRDDHSQKRYHSDSSGMSGGQKAKLAYTILASAVAYQYGTNAAEQPEQTFRFVVVDEAFSKVDDNNARYAMDLFGQLGLQLLVVTPLDKLHIVEPYVGAYHYVYNNEEGSDSRVINLTVEEFQQRRRELLSAGD